LFLKRLNYIFNTENSVNFVIFDVMMPEKGTKDYIPKPYKFAEFITKV